MSGDVAYVSFGAGLSSRAVAVPRETARLKPHGCAVLYLKM